MPNYHATRKKHEQEANPLLDAQENLRDAIAVPRWAPDKVESKLRAAFRIDELEAMLEAAEEDEAN